MKQEFITVHGKVVLEKGILFIHPVQFSFTESLFYRVMRPIVPFIAFTIYLLWESEESRKYMGLLFWGLLSLAALPSLYQMLVHRSFAYRIPVDRISGIELRDDALGLQTELILKLKNGRERVIAFRTLEKQYELLQEVLLPQLSTTQIIAH